MAKLTNVKERVQQPFRDSLIRTAGLAQGAVSERNNLFQTNNNSKGIGETNLPQGNVLPSDQSMIILALRVFLAFRNPVQRSGATNQSGQAFNGDISTFPVSTDSSMGLTRDVYRLYFQAEEQLLWTFGAGAKPSIESMPSAYFPYGGGLVTDLAGASDLIHANNGLQTHGSILKLARAILLVPRQSILCQANIAPYPTAGVASTFGTTQGARNMYSLTDNLNVVDAIQKIVSFTFDGLLSRDVQLHCTNRDRPTPRAPARPIGGRGFRAFSPPPREAAAPPSPPKRYPSP